MNYKKITIFIILFLGIFFRLYQIGSVPPGLNIDEASHGYNSKSILETGKDRYGEFLPQVFRSFGTYLLPLYTYLTIIPVAIFGLNIFSVRLVEAISSILLIFITYLIFSNPKIFSRNIKLLTTFLVAVSPWAIFFGRGGHEASLSLTLFVLSFFLFTKALSNPKWLILSFLMAGFSGLAYYTERYLALVFFPIAIWVFWNKFKSKKIIFISVLVFVIIQLPQLLLLNSNAFSRRIEQVNYWSDKSFNQNGGSLKTVFFGKQIYIIQKFTTNYLEYFSPRSLFVDPDPQLARSMPDLSIFYIWMIVPFWFGVKVLLKKISQATFKILAILLVVAPIPAALTGDPFYSIRTLTFFWVLTIVIALGCDYLLGLITSGTKKILIIVLFSIISFVLFYSSYFILLKHERSGIYGYEYQQLIEKLEKYKGKQVVIDSGRTVGAQIWIPFYKNIDPQKFQKQTSDSIKNNYYNNTNLDSVIKLDNFEIRAISWKDDTYEDEIIVGDDLAISEEQIKEHKLIFLFEVIGLDGEVKLKAYDSNAKENCMEALQKGLMNNQNCKKYI